MAPTIPVEGLRQIREDELPKQKESSSARHRGPDWQQTPPPTSARQPLEPARPMRAVVHFPPGTCHRPQHSIPPAGSQPGRQHFWSLGGSSVTPTSARQDGTALTDGMAIRGGDIDDGSIVPDAGAQQDWRPAEEPRFRIQRRWTSETMRDAWVRDRNRNNNIRPFSLFRRRRRVSHPPPRPPFKSITKDS